jgi:hypothetical protein
MAKAIGSGWWPGQTNESEESQEFWMKFGSALTELNNGIDTAIREKNGNDLLLMDAALRALITNIAECLSQCEIKIEQEWGVAILILRRGPPATSVLRSKTSLKRCV